MAVDAHGMPVKMIVTEGTTADCTQASALIEGVHADYLLADRAYDSDTILEHAEKQGMNPVIPPKKNRKEQRSYHKKLYKIRHTIENTFLRLKRWRGIATRYAKRADSFLAIVHIRCIALWCAILWRHYLGLSSGRTCFPLGVSVFRACLQLDATVAIMLSKRSGSFTF